MSGCGVCGGPIKQPATGRARVYCSDNCRQRACRAARRVTKPNRARSTFQLVGVTKLAPELREWLRHETNRKWLRHEIDRRKRVRIAEATEEQAA